MKILIVDDEMAALTKMKVLLSAFGDCTLCTNAQQALQMCAKAIQASNPFDLVTIDIHLGSADGNDLLEDINQLEIKEHSAPAKKIMVSASGTKENLVKAYSKGCDGFIVKPVQRDALEQKMLSLGYIKK
ncbi:MAG: response regulator [Desulfatitalea sp.]